MNKIQSMLEIPEKPTFSGNDHTTNDAQSYDKENLGNYKHRPYVASFDSTEDAASVNNIAQSGRDSNKLPPYFVPLHRMICGFIDEKIDEIEELYQALSREKLGRLSQENHHLQKLLIEQKHDLEEAALQRGIPDGKNASLEEDLTNALDRISFLEEEKVQLSLKHRREKTVISHMLVETRESVIGAMQECMQRTKEESAGEIKALELALAQSQSENEALKSRLAEQDPS